MLDRQTVASRSSCTRNAVSNGSRLHARGTDGRTREARRFRDLIESFAESLGGEAKLNEAERALIRNAASLAVKAEMMQAAIVKGEEIDLEALTRLSNCVSRVLGQLNIKRTARERAPTLAEYLAQPIGEGEA
jgi:hypothetical protein